MGHRMSSLPIAQFCGRSPVLSSKYGAGRAAIMGRAFHACASGEEDAADLLASLSEVEREEITSWLRPEDAEVHGITVEYEEAKKEFMLALGPDGEPTTVEESALTVGHPDMAWVYKDEEMSVAIVGDIKKSAFTVSDGPNSLQLLAYGYTMARMYDCDSFVVGIWAAIEGEWSWGRKYDMFDDGPGIWRRIKMAASMQDEARTGTHCSGCWARMHCTEHMLPALPGGHELEMLSEGGGGIQTQDDARKALQLVSAMESMVKVAKSQTQEWARRNGGIVSEDGKKKYLPVQTKGRKSVDKAALERDGLLEKYQRQGAPYDQFRWLKA